MSFELITALLTPLNNQHHIDYDSLFQLIDQQINNGISRFVLFGTTGEGSSLPMKEKIECLRKIRKKYKNKLYIIIGISSLSTRESIREIKRWNIENIDCFLCLTPTYLLTNEQGIIEHYFALSNATKKDLLIYYVPKRTGQSLKYTTLQLLKKQKNIIGIKYASSIKEDPYSLLNLQEDNFKVYLGNDDEFLLGLKYQFDGLISVFSNEYPSCMQKIISHYSSLKHQEIEKIWEPFNQGVHLLFQEPNPIGIKYLYYLHNGGTLNYILPLVDPSQDFITKISAWNRKDEIDENLLNWDR